MILVRNLSKSYPEREVLQTISFQADPGDFIAVIGGSGSGKTTLLRCLALRDKWDTGQYIWNGKDVLVSGYMELWKLRRKLSFLEEIPAIDPNVTAKSNVMLGVKSQQPIWKYIPGLTSSGDHVTALDALDQVGLLEKADQKAGKLSGGEKQRVAIAMAYAQGTKLILADEPVTGLAPDAANSVMADFRKLCQTHKMIVICTTSNIELAEKHATRIWGLAQGRIAVDVSGRRLTQQEKRQILG
jgi:phosphonate transport system ATP-binding protein